MLSLDSSPIPFSNLNKQSPLDIISSSSTDFTNETKTLRNQSCFPKNAKTLSRTDDVSKTLRSKVFFEQATTSNILLSEKVEKKRAIASVNQNLLRSFIDSTPLSPISVICNLYDSAENNFFVRADSKNNDENSVKSPNQNSNFEFEKDSSISEELNTNNNDKCNSNLDLISPTSRPSGATLASADTNFTTMKVISTAEINSIENFSDDLESPKIITTEKTDIQKTDQVRLSEKIKKYFSLPNISISRSKSISDLCLEPESPKQSNLAYSAGSNSVLHQQASYRQKIINELIETENAYIEFLKSMSDNLIEILETAKTTIKSLNSNLIFNNNIESLIIEHRKFLYEIQKLTNNSSYSSYSYYCMSTASIIPNVNDKLKTSPENHNKYNQNEKEPINNFSTSNLTKVVYSSLTTAGAALVCKLVAEKAINTYFYSEYFSTFSVISHLLLKLNSLDSSVSRGIDKLSKSVQILDSKLDLSLNSLLQKPVSRLGKYRIICETLLKFMPSNDKYTLEIQTHLGTIRRKSNNINAFSRDEVSQYDSSKKNIFDRLIISPKSVNPKIHNYNLGNVIEPVFDGKAIPLESLGIPILSGSLGVVWIEKNKYFCYNIYGILLFKSNIIICKIENDQRYVIKFMIPLGCCKIVEAEATEGLYCVYRECFKILFEYQFSTFELLLVGLLKNEINIWKEKLALLTDFVNGPYNFDYSISESYDFLTYILPNNIEPVDTSLNNCFSEGYDFLNNCYFGELLSFQIQYVKDLSTHDLPKVSTESNSKTLTTYNNVEENNKSFINIKKKRRRKTSIKKNVSTVTSSPILRFEQKVLQNVHFNMKDVYSSELPNMYVDKLKILAKDVEEHYADDNLMSCDTRNFKQQLVFLKNETRRISNSIISKVNKLVEDENDNEKVCDKFSQITIESNRTVTRDVSTESITSISAELTTKSSTRNKLIQHSKILKDKLR